jgi:Mn2+/Fe2+ NRAMP family transporter
LIVWVLPFQGIERLFGYIGLGLLTFVIAAIKLHPDWGTVASGLIPHINQLSPWSYLYFAVGIIAAAFMPYEVYFYSSGAIEEKWKPGDMIINRSNSIIGFILGGFVVAGIIIVSANVLGSSNISPQFLGTSVLGVATTLGSAGLILAILGAIFAIGGAAVETSFSAAYNLSQFLGWKWGKHEDKFKVPRFTLSWIILFILAAILIVTGIDPITLTEYAVIFSVVAMPLTYIPIFLLARDKKAMGKFVNKKLSNVLGWIYLAVIIVISIAALPLMIFTNRGQI